MLVTTQKWCKYNFGDDDESTVALSRNVESKESFHTALKYCQIKCRGEREREKLYLEETGNLFYCYLLSKIALNKPELM